MIDHRGVTGVPCDGRITASNFGGVLRGERSRPATAGPGVGATPLRGVNLAMNRRHLFKTPQRCGLFLHCWMHPSQPHPVRRSRLCRCRTAPGCRLTADADRPDACKVDLVSDGPLPAEYCVLLRREIVLDTLPSAATGRVLADSRYKLTVNGVRVQWGRRPPIRAGPRPIRWT